MCIKPVGELGVNLLLNEGSCFGVAQLGLGLAFELGLGELDRNNGRQTFAHVITGQVVILLADDALFAAVAVHQGGQRGTETFFVHATFGGIDGVCEGVNRRGIRRGPLHGDFHAHGAFVVFRFEVNDVSVDRFDLLCRIQVFHVVTQAMLIHVGNLAESLVLFFRGLLVSGDFVAFIRGSFALIGQGDTQSLVEECHLLEALTQGFEIEDGGLKDFGIRVEGLRRSGFSGFFTTNQFGNGVAAVSKGHPPYVSLPANLRINTRGQGIHNRDTHTVKTAGNRVTAAAELTARVQDGHNDLNRRLVLGRVLINGNTASVIDDANAAIGQDRDLNVVRVASQGLVNGVIYNLIHQVM